MFYHISRVYIRLYISKAWTIIDTGQCLNNVETQYQEPYRRSRQPSRVSLFDYFQDRRLSRSIWEISPNYSKVSRTTIRFRPFFQFPIQSTDDTATDPIRARSSELPAVQPAINRNPFKSVIIRKNLFRKKSQQASLRRNWSDEPKIGAYRNSRRVSFQLAGGSDSESEERITYSPSVVSILESPRRLSLVTNSTQDSDFTVGLHLSISTINDYS